MLDSDAVEAPLPHTGKEVNYSLASIQKCWAFQPERLHLATQRDRRPRCEYRLGGQNTKSRLASSCLVFRYLSPIYATAAFKLFEVLTVCNERLAIHGSAVS